MLIKKSQVILKCFIDLKSSVWFTLGSEQNLVLCRLELLSAPLPVNSPFILGKFHKSKKHS